MTLPNLWWMWMCSKDENERVFEYVSESEERGKRKEELPRTKVGMSKVELCMVIKSRAEKVCPARAPIRVPSI
jgi:hypothetical protein